MNGKKIRVEKDPRVNANTTVRDGILIFFVLMVFSGLHMVVYVTILQNGQSVQFLINALIGWLVFCALVLSLITTFGRYYTMGRPLRRFSEAAKKVAAGDFSVRIAPLRKDGKKDYVELLFDDFNTMTEELASIENMKNDFIADVSHEIKTPLSVIQGYVSALRDDELTADKRNEYIKTIIEASQKLSVLVSNILKLNKLENQEIIPKGNPYNLSEQLRRCALLFEESWERKEITFNAELDEAVIAYDAHMLELVWNNLLSNALKFTEKGGAIELKAKIQDGIVLVSLKDSGCGMDEKTVKHIFEKFYQGDSSHAREGNGLGLALVKKVMEITGGEILVDSRPGQGTKFIVKLKSV
ncbi:two component sensor kinase [Spirochaetia bacterium]|nr:two component sensor kinase [Spirochaetia bacterium]